ncbi:unnamed protein product [Adineta ricciae]|uniref:Uncharacterized protein n=1 Tax=Adineta ricciae TaxID=249248 RepID=A0A814AWQ5_ADIRI|nr:unnamed protein product [Adineta ricciae]
MTASTSLDIVHKVPTHPRILIQPDWSVNVKLNTLPADVWLEFKSGNASISRLTQNVHGVCSIKALTDDNAKSYKTSASDNFQSTDIDRKQQQLRIKIRDTNFSHTFQGKLYNGPTKSFSTTGKPEDAEGHAIQDPLINVPERRQNQTHLSAHPHWCDISSGGVGLTALSNGNVTIWDIENGEVRRKLKGHVEDVYTSRFFPSDLAVVSGGADMRVKVWSIDSDNNQIRDTTLTGHRSRINDVLALDKQRVLSASNDGSVLLWDITKNEQISKVTQLDNDSVNSISLTDSATLACACNDGTIRFYNLSNKEIGNELKVGSPISTLCYLNDSNQLVYGTEHSILGFYDLRQMNGTPVHAWKEQRGKITCVVPSHDQGGILVTTTDGSCFEYNKNELQTMSDILQQHVCDYTGADEAVLNSKVFNNRIYSICHDGLVRVYDRQEETK